MSKKEESYQDENAKLLEEAEKIASKLSINLKSFYDEKVQIRDQYIQSNDAKKVLYEDLSKADSFGANNGFKGIVKELEYILNFVNDFHDGSIESYKSDEMDKEIYEGQLKIIESWFEHICKWIGNEK
tara:strand:- start:213 stop:596 length:384 start_codon:yes stop_codon:yes gene_type:complete